MSVMFRKDFNDLYYNNEWKGFFNPFNTKISLTEVWAQPIFFALDKILHKINSQSTRNICKGVFLVVSSPVLFSVLIVSMSWRFVKDAFVSNISVFGRFCVQSWLDVRRGPQANEETSLSLICSAMANTVAYIALFPLVEVVALCCSLYEVILRDLSLMHKFCQLCGNEAYKNAKPGGANVGGVNCNMFNGCHALDQEKLNKAFAPSK